MTASVKILNEGPGDVVLRRVNAQGKFIDSELPIIVGAGLISEIVNVDAGTMLRVADRADDKLEG